MMSKRATLEPAMTYEQYLALEERSPKKHEYLRGEIIAMAGGSYDRGAKFADYRHLASLREYVLVSQHEPRIEVYRRNEHGRFELFESVAGETFELAAIGATLTVDEIYANPLDVS